MIILILSMQFILGGTAYHIATNTYNAINDYNEVKNWLNSGYVTRWDYQFCTRKLIHWCAITLAFIIAWVTIIFLSVLILTL